MSCILNFLVIVFTFSGMTQTYAQDSQTKKLNLNELALPSEVKNLGKQSGAIYYSPSIKKKALIPVHFWGEVKNTGLHFIPVETSFIKGLSLAGGPGSNANLERVFVTRNRNGNQKNFTFDLTEDEGHQEANSFVYQPGDIVYFKRDRYFEDRAYYTSLVSVAITFLSGIILYNQVKDL